MTAAPDDEETTDPVEAAIKHRRFIAIATSTYEDPRWGTLPVKDEVQALARWFCHEDLGKRRFTHEHQELADNPTKEQIEAAIKTWRHTDAGIVYITGHGHQDVQDHWLILRNTRTDKIMSSALRTSDLVGWLKEGGIEHLLLIIDTCYAGEVASGVARFREPMPKTWLALASSAQDEEAVPGALTGAIQKVVDELGGPTGERYGRDPYLNAGEFWRAVDQKLDGTQRVILMPGSQIGGRHLCLPNPKYRPPHIVSLRPPRRDLALPKAELESHWEPRSRGGIERNVPGWFFTGRAELMSRLIRATKEPGAVLVTGRLGSGKSAALARLVTLSDPEFRSQYAERVALIPAGLLPEEEAVDVAVLATGKNAAGIMTRICQAVEALDATDSEPSLEKAQKAWKDWLSQSARPVTIVIDALDEAARPNDVLTEVLQRLVDTEPGRRRVRLIVGARSVGGPDLGEGSRIEDAEDQLLADRVQRALHIEPRQGRIQVDQPPWWVREDMVDYITSLLRLSPNSPYGTAESDTVKAIADVITNEARRSFLFANMAARQLAAREEVVEVNDPAWRVSISQDVLGLFREDLHRAVPDRKKREKAVHLLRAVAFSFGPGLPWPNIWPLVATAIADEKHHYGDSDIAEFLDTPLGGYLVTDCADGITTYRLFHDKLRSILCEDWKELLEEP